MMNIADIIEETQKLLELIDKIIPNNIVEYNIETNCEGTTFIDDCENQFFDIIY